MAFEDGHRQRSSGALIFVPSPEQVRYTETAKQLEKELAEVRELKKELESIVKENRG